MLQWDKMCKIPYIILPSSSSLFNIQCFFLFKMVSFSKYSDREVMVKGFIPMLTCRVH